jgi:hypothetical protein
MSRLLDSGTINGNIIYLPDTVRAGIILQSTVSDPEGWLSVNDGDLLDLTVVEKNPDNIKSEFLGSNNLLCEVGGYFFGLRRKVFEGLVITRPVVYMYQGVFQSAFQKLSLRRENSKIKTL